MNDLKRKDTKLETNLFEIAWKSMEHSDSDDDVKLFREYYKRMFHSEDRKYRGLARWACQNFAAMKSSLMENVGSSSGTAAVADTIQPEGGDIDQNLLPPRKRMKTIPLLMRKHFSML